MKDNGSLPYVGISKPIMSKLDKYKLLLQEVMADPKEGLHRWKIEQAQGGALKQACQAINDKVSEGNFELSDISALKKDFSLRPEDEEIIHWFERANNYLDEACNELEALKLPEANLKAASKELKFIISEETFFERFELMTLLGYTQSMLTKLEEHLKTFTDLKREELQQKEAERENEKIELALKEKEAEAEKARLEHETALAKKEKQALQLKHEEEKYRAAEAEMNLLDKQQEQRIAEEARQRALELSSSYDQLQGTQSAEALSLIQRLEQLRVLLETQSLSQEEQLDVKKLIHVLVDKL